MARLYSFGSNTTGILTDILVRPDRSVSIRDSIAPAWTLTTRQRAASALRLYRRAVVHTPGVYTLTRSRV